MAHTVRNISQEAWQLAIHSITAFATHAIVRAASAVVTAKNFTREEFQAGVKPQACDIIDSLLSICRSIENSNSAPIS